MKLAKIVTALAGGLLLAGGALRSHAAVCDARNYGAKPDGKTVDTAAIQKAIDACAAKGGGTVTLEGGVFLSAPIVLKSDIELRIAKGAELLGSSNHADYPRKIEFRNPGRQALISATNGERISITGGGVIDGAGASWWKEARSGSDHGVMGAGVFRPRLIVFDHCRHVLMEGVTVRNSPSWQIVPYYSDDVILRDLRILADPHSPNTDAIDPFSSSHVLIERVYADVGDDDIAIKSGAIGSPGPDSPSRDIAIRHCTFMHGHGLSIGSEIAGGARDIAASDIRFDGTDQGIRIKANRDRGSDVGHIVFRNLAMKNVGAAILITEYYPKVLPPEGGAAPAPITRLTPRFHDISIENLRASGAKSAGAIAGLPEAPVRSVRLKNVSIAAATGMVVVHADVTGSGVAIHAQTGPAIVQGPGAKVNLTR